MANTVTYHSGWANIDDKQYADLVLSHDTANASTTATLLTPLPGGHLIITDIFCDNPSNDFTLTLYSGTNDLGSFSFTAGVSNYIGRQIQAKRGENLGYRITAVAGDIKFSIIQTS